MIETQIETANKISFFVPGIPKPGGSKSAFRNRYTGKVIVKDANKKVKEWKGTVAFFASEKYGGIPLLGPIKLEITFVMPRPKGHYGTGRNAGVLKPSAPRWHERQPDRTKLLRSTEDALKGILWKDDSQVCAGEPKKIYGEKTGAHISVESLEPQEDLFK